MSIAPFLPGLPVPVPDGGTTSDAPAGDAGSAFGDALAAALAGTLAGAPAATTPTTPTPAAPTSAASTPAPPAPALPAPAAPAPALQATVDLPTPAVDLGVPSVDLAVSSVDLGIPSVELGVSSAESALVQVAVAAAADEARATTADEAASALRRTTGVGDARGATPFPAAASTGAEVGTVGENTDSTDETAKSIDETPKSTHANPNSTVANAGSTVANAGSSVAKAVVQQVFPEVTRIVSTVGTPGGPGNGTHRITLTLQPEQLGEVRVTLVVRDGAVHVRLSGAEGVEGAAVHRALASEAPELQRILERTGADARVTVRDPFAPLLPSAPAASGTQSGTQTGTQSGPQTGTQTGPDAQGRSETQARQERQDGHAPREQPREQRGRPEPQRASYPIGPTTVTGRLDRTV